MNFDYLIIGVYLLATLAIGFNFGKKMNTIEDFSVSTRKFSTSMLIATLTATLIGAENILAMTQRVFEVGIIYIVVCIGLPLNRIFMSIFIAPKINFFRRMISVGDIMKLFYGRQGQMVTGMAGFLLSLGYVGAQICAIGYFCNFFFSLPSFLGILLGASVVTFYSASGGIRSVTRTDAIQLAVILLFLPFLSNIGFHLTGGYSKLIEFLPETHLSLIPTDHSLLYYISLFFIFCFPFLDPAIVQRLLMSKNTMQLRQALQLTALIEFICYSVIGMIGLICLMVIPNAPSDALIPYLINNVLPVGVKGLVVTGVLAIIMSTADSYLNAGSICLTHDFIKPILGDRINTKDELFIARLVTVAMGIFSVLAAISKKNVMDIVLMFCNFWAPVVMIPLIAGMFSYRATSRAFICSIISGILTALLWMFYLEAKLGFDGLIPSILANALVFFSVDRKQVVWADPFDHESLKQPLTPTEMQAAMRGE